MKFCKSPGGIQRHNIERWNTILGEERGEVERAILDLVYSPTNEIDSHMDHLRDELLQVAAVAVAIVERIDAADDALLEPEGHVQKRTMSETTEAIEHGYRKSKEQWRTAALAAVRKVAKSYRRFTIDDVRAVMEGDGTLHGTHDLRALGGVLRTALKIGAIRRTEKYAPSSHGHSRPIVIWESLVTAA